MESSIYPSFALPFEFHFKLLFNLLRLTKRNLRSARSRTQVVFMIFSFIIKSKAELSTVFKIWACNPLKNPISPSLLQMA